MASRQARPVKQGVDSRNQDQASHSARLVRKGREVCESNNERPNRWAGEP
jgi:hypothetical protein